MHPTRGCGRFSTDYKGDLDRQGAQCLSLNRLIFFGEIMTG